MWPPGVSAALGSRPVQSGTAGGEAASMPAMAAKATKAETSDVPIRRMTILILSLPNLFSGEE